MITTAFKPFAILTGNPDRYGSTQWTLTGYTYMGDTPNDGVFLHTDLPGVSSTSAARAWAASMLKRRGYRVAKWRPTGTAELESIA